MKKLFCCLALLVFLPLCAHAQELPQDVEHFLDEPGVSAEEFRQFSLGDLVKSALAALKEQAEQPVRLLVQVLGPLCWEPWPWRWPRRKSGSSRWRAFACWGCLRSAFSPRWGL